MNTLHNCSRFRNYGCRIKEYSSSGISMISLENDLVKVSVASGKGADIVEFLHKSSDTDFMWHSFQGMDAASHMPTVAASGGSFLDTYSGGWQELFPVYGAPANFEGAEIGIHGEACIYPWQVEIIEDSEKCISVRFTLDTLRTPFTLEKILTINLHSTKLIIDQAVTNLSTVPQEFMWAHHPAFGFPFLDNSVKLRLGGKPSIHVPAGTISHNCPFDKETIGEWPYLLNKDNEQIDMSCAYAKNDKIGMEYLISNLEIGEYELFNFDKKIGIRLNWDISMFPYLWVWGMYGGHEKYPWYGRAYTMAVEPWSCSVGDYSAARKKGELIQIKPGERITTAVNATLITDEG